MNLKRKLSILLVVLVIAFGCRKSNILSDSKELTEFKILAQFNSDFLKKDIVGKISDNKINLIVPRGLDLTNLRASFAFSGRQILISGTEQQSDVSVNDFSKNISYNIKAEDGSQISYSLVLSYVDDLGLVMSSFSLLIANNPDLKQDLNLLVNANKITGKLKSSKRLFKATFNTLAADVSISDIKQQSGVTVNDFSGPVIYTLTSEYGLKAQFTVTINWESAVPHIYIETTNSAPIVSKEEYLNATIRIEGKGAFEDYKGTTKIKGRGNSTWIYYPKKPYRLKLDKKAPLLGLAEDKDWVLLANYIDPTLMLNGVAMKTGELLKMPYTNHIIPVEVTINGIELGCYNFTEQVAVAEKRINIGGDGTLLELDSYFDEPWEFKSASFDLPVMVKYPDIKSQSELDLIQADFQVMEKAVASSSFPNNDYADYIDIDALVNYLLVCNLTDNEEINHPKSIYMYKTKNGKYTMGPLWDFDWAYGYEGSQVHFSSSNRPPFWSNPEQGTEFFSRFLNDPKVKTLYKQKWIAFKANKLQELISYIGATSALIETAQQRDYTVWNQGNGNFREGTLKLIEWIQNRASYIDGYVAGF